MNPFAQQTWQRTFGLLLVFAVLLLSFSHDAEARKRRRGRHRHGGGSCGHCSSGYGLQPPTRCGASASSPVQKFYEQNRGSMVSCCRPPDGQDRLRRCFNACGQPGRAAVRSNHSRGQACDSRASGRRYGLKLLFHHGSHHWSTTGR